MRMFSVALECDCESPRDAAAYAVFLVPPVLPPEDLAGRVFLHWCTGERAI